MRPPPRLFRDAGTISGMRIRQACVARLSRPSSLLELLPSLRAGAYMRPLQISSTRPQKCAAPLGALCAPPPFVSRDVGLLASPASALSRPRPRSPAAADPSSQHSSA